MDKAADHGKSVTEIFYLSLLYEEDHTKWKFYDLKNFMSKLEEMIYFNAPNQLYV